MPTKARFIHSKESKSPKFKKLNGETAGNFPVKGVSDPLEIWEVFDPSVTEDSPTPSQELPAKAPENESAPITLLKNLVKINWRKFQVTTGSSGNRYDFLILEGEPGQGFELDENYLHEDLDSLVAQGLLRESYSSSGDKIYSITRAGDRLVQESAPRSNSVSALKVTAKKEIRYYQNNPTVRYYVCELLIENPNPRAAENLIVELESVFPNPSEHRSDWDNYQRLPSFPYPLSRLDSTSSILNPHAKARYEFFKVPREGSPPRFQIGALDSFVAGEVAREFRIAVSAIDQPHRTIRYKICATLDPEGIPTFEIDAACNEG